MTHAPSAGGAPSVCTDRAGAPVSDFARSQVLAADQLIRVSDLPALTGLRAPLRALAADLRSGDPVALATWQDVDLVEAFDPWRVAGDEPVSDRRATLVRRAAPVLFFLPLILTWGSLKLATSAYGEMIDELGEVPQEPFLTLWVDGFGGRSFTFGLVAALTLISILALVGGQLASTTLAEREARTRAATLRTEAASLSAALLAARRVLSEHRNGVPFVIDQRLRDGAEQLAESTVETKRILSTVQRATTKAQNLMDRQLSLIAETQDQLESTLQVMAATSSAMADTAGGVHAAVDRLGGEISTLGDRVVAGSSAASQAMDSALKTHSDTIANAVAAQESAAAARLQVARSESAATHADLATLLDGRIAALGRAVESVAATLAAHTTDSLGGITDSMGRLTDAVTQTQTLHEVSAGAADAQVVALELLIDRAEQLVSLLGSMPAAGDRARAVDRPATPLPGPGGADPDAVELDAVDPDPADPDPADPGEPAGALAAAS